MKETDFSVLLQKADELKALFVLGQRVIPFLEEIFIFVRDIKPLLDEINVNIEENLKKMPGASKQLSKVTEATELATTEIMDIVDGLDFKSNIISTNLKRLNDIDEEMRSKTLSLDEKNDASSTNEYQEISKKTFDLLDSIKTDSSSIMMALQVQDITSQQIAAVNYMLQTVQGKLTSIMDRFQSSEISELVEEQAEHSERTNTSKLHRTIAFDPEAVDSISLKDIRQKEVDEIYSKKDEILLETDKDSSKKENKSNNSEKKLINSSETKETYETVSQDDIDALFGK